MAHVINLAVQTALASLKATAENSEDIILWELEKECNIETINVISKVIKNYLNLNKI
jgi:hypothetical protein